MQRIRLNRRFKKQAAISSDNSAAGERIANLQHLSYGSTSLAYQVEPFFAIGILPRKEHISASFRPSITDGATSVDFEIASTVRYRRVVVHQLDRIVAGGVVTVEAGKFNS
jgi:hypothetical protein